MEDILDVLFTKVIFSVCDFLRKASNSTLGQFFLKLLDLLYLKHFSNVKKIMGSFCQTCVITLWNYRSIK